jgi:hypothetical protein
VLYGIYLGTRLSALSSHAKGGTCRELPRFLIGRHLNHPPSRLTTMQVEVWEHDAERESSRRLKTIACHTAAVRTVGFVNQVRTRTLKTLNPKRLFEQTEPSILP